MHLLDRVPHREIGMYLVAVPPPRSLPFEVAGRFEVGDDALHRALGDPHVGCHIPDPHLRVPGETDQDMAVVGQERP